MDFSVIIDKLEFTGIMWQIITPLIFSLADVITGYAQAWINNNMDSKIMREGLIHKMLLVLIILLSFVLQYAFNIKFISSVVCAYIILMEIVSILENLKKAGVDLGNLEKILKDKEK